MKQSKEKEGQFVRGSINGSDKRLMRFQLEEIASYPDGVIIGAEEWLGNNPKRQTEMKMKLMSVPGSNAIVLSTNESGGRSCFMDQNIAALSRCSTKPNLIIFDSAIGPYRRHAKSLESQGYQVFLLDFQCPSASDKWNPYAALVWRVKLIRELSNELDNRDGKYYAVGETFTTYKEVRNRLNEIREELYKTAENIVNCIFRLNEETIECETARKLITAFTIALCEDCIASQLGTSELILSNVYQNLFCYCNGNSIILKSYLIGKRNKYSKAKALAEEIFHDGPQESLNAIMKSVVQMMSACCSDKLLNLTCENWIDLYSETDMPTAVFLVGPEAEETVQRYIELFLTQSYTAKEEISVAASKKAGYIKPTFIRPWYYLINGYDLLPRTIFNCSLFSGAQFQRRLILIAKSYAQLIKQYGEAFGEWVKTECQVKLFLNAEDGERRKEYYELCCGKSDGEALSKAEMELYDKVNGLGNAVVAIYNAQPFITKFTPSYKHPNDFFPEGDMPERSVEADSSYWGACFDISRLLEKAIASGVLEEEVT